MFRSKKKKLIHQQLDFVEGGVDWTQHDELTDPGNAFYSPNNDMTMPSSDEGKLALQEWFFPTGDP